MMVVEWRRLLREAGVEDLHVEDWSDEETSFRPTVVKPFPDFAELFSLGERMAILRRAWGVWGWRGVSAAIARENEVHKLLTGERILGLDLLRGRKAGGEPKEPAAAVFVEEKKPDEPEPSVTTPRIPVDPVPGDEDGDETAASEDESSSETAGLPLFGGDGDGG